MLDEKALSQAEIGSLLRDETPTTEQIERVRDNQERAAALEKAGLPAFVHHSFTLKVTPITKDSWGDMLQRVANLENIVERLVMNSPAPPPTGSGSTSSQPPLDGLKE